VNKFRRKGFYFITDSGLTVNGIAEDVRQAIAAGSVMVQYREKGKTAEERLVEAREIQAICNKAKVPFIVNDDVALAKEIRADGVHVGPHDMSLAEARKSLGKKAIVGVSVGSAEEAKAAEKQGASYVAASPVFVTPTKPDAGLPVGIMGLKKIRAATKLPVVAIGGINESNVTDVAAGVDMVCAISASLKDGKVEENIRRLTSLFK
jgi:thiamine-phosphate pyrophosphorylase